MVNNINFLIVILVALVTTVIVSLIIASITGNAIKVKSSDNGTKISAHSCDAEIIVRLIMQRFMVL